MSVAAEPAHFPVQSVTPRTWSRRIMGGDEQAEICPAWCTDHHRGDEYGALDDLQHGTKFDAVPVPVFDWADGTNPLPILGARLAVDPYSDDPARRIPHILLEVAPDEYTLPLSPAGALAVIGEVRAHLDRLERVVLGQMVAARAEVGAA